MNKIFSINGSHYRAEPVNGAFCAGCAFVSEDIDTDGCVKMPCSDDDGNYYIAKKIPDTLPIPNTVKVIRGDY